MKFSDVPLIFKTLHVLTESESEKVRAQEDCWALEMPKKLLHIATGLWKISGKSD